MLRILAFTYLFLLVFSCQNPSIPDIVILHANLYAVDTVYRGADAIAIKNGKIISIGSSAEIEAMCDLVTKKIDAKGNFTMPGFIEAHGHFMSLGYSLINLNLQNTKSWKEIIKQVEARCTEVQPGEWIIGRGWHQEKWDSVPKKNIYGYPFHDELSRISTSNPVILYHASGHAIFANKMAMDLVGITDKTPNPVGGAILWDKKGNAIGVFEERAMDVFKEAYDDYIKNLDAVKTDSIWMKAFTIAEDICISKGVTSFQDAGSKIQDLKKFETHALSGKMHLRLWAMIRETSQELKKDISQCKKIGVNNHFYTCNAVKSELDGALGSYGAWLLEPYNDKPNYRGLNTTDVFEVKKIAELAMENDMQMCVHAIGDRANRVVLDIYEGVMDAHPDKKDLRWRVEHAQHIQPDDIKRFNQHGIIASMQGIHCTSDAPFVVKRLGEQRAKSGAYAWRSFLDQGVKIANGTDTPIEDVDPIKNFYASVTRRRIDNGMTFYPEQKMTREEAVYSYTLGNAYAAKEEALKGSLRVGKLADIVILSNDLIHCSDDDILKTKILYTIINGNVEFNGMQ
ncbi:MAG: amidohydrolase [Lewinellaceae bacterium]|nr:amidohydrolase [Lewinellaceae bacterium]